MYPLPGVSLVVLAHLALSITGADARPVAARGFVIRADDSSSATSTRSATPLAAHSSSTTASSTSFKELVEAQAVPTGVIETHMPGSTDASSTESSAAKGNSSSGISQLSAGAIAGITSAAMFSFVALVLLVGFYLYMAKQRRVAAKKAAAAALREKPLPIAVTNPFTDDAAVHYFGSPKHGGDVERGHLPTISEESFFTGPSQHQHQPQHPPQPQHPYDYQYQYQYQYPQPEVWRHSNLTVDTSSSLGSSSMGSSVVASSQGHARVGSPLQRLMDSMALPQVPVPAATRYGTPLSPHGNAPFVPPTRRQFISISPRDTFTPEETSSVLPWSPIRVLSPAVTTAASTQRAPNHPSHELVVRTVVPVPSPDSASTASTSSLISPRMLESFPLSPFDPAADDVDIRSQAPPTPSTIGPIRHTRNGSTMSFSVMSLVDNRDSIVESYGDQQEVLSDYAWEYEDDQSNPH